MEIRWTLDEDIAPALCDDLRAIGLGSDVAAHPVYRVRPRRFESVCRRVGEGIREHIVAWPVAQHSARQACVQHLASYRPKTGLRVRWRGACAMVRSRKPAASLFFVHLLAKANKLGARPSSQPRSHSCNTPGALMDTLDKAGGPTHLTCRGSAILRIREISGLQTMAILKEPSETAEFNTPFSKIQTPHDNHIVGVGVVSSKNSQSLAHSPVARRFRCHLTIKFLKLALPSLQKQLT